MAKEASIVPPRLSLIQPEVDKDFAKSIHRKFNAKASYSDLHEADFAKSTLPNEYKAEERAILSNALQIYNILLSGKALRQCVECFALQMRGHLPGKDTFC